MHRSHTIRPSETKGEPPKTPGKILKEGKNKPQSLAAALPAAPFIPKKKEIPRSIFWTWSLARAPLQVPSSAILSAMFTLLGKLWVQEINFTKEKLEFQKRGCPFLSALGTPWGTRLTHLILILITTGPQNSPMSGLKTYQECAQTLIKKWSWKWPENEWILG